jgi:endonuclease/exonuclease/phosphatase family metal-dependent hydrolase
MRLRLVSYNIHKCIGGVDRRYRPERIEKTIRHHAPDLVLLQEVANTAGRVQWHRQVDLLGDQLGFRNRTWFPNHRFRRGGEYGNAILSRWPITDTENIDLTIDGTKRRSVLHARIRVRTDAERSRTLHVFCLHLGLTERIRDLQLQRFLQSGPFAGLHAQTPILVAGDFNDVWGSLGPKHLLPAGFRGMPARIRTFPAWAPVQALDAVYVRGDASLDHVHRSRLPLATRASDHLPLVAELDLPS